MFDSLKINSYISHLVLILVLCITFFAGAVFFVINYGTVDFSQLTISTQKGKPSIILDDEGKEWTRFQLDKREPISLDQMPTHLIHAFLAAEDWQFFSHGGLSFRGIVRSLLVNIYHGRFVQGASTITQQLVKLLFFDSQKTFRRKIKEQIYSLLIEYQCTKEQILQTYLNNIYFGCGIYGVEAAAQRFWGISAKEISIDQAALLAGIVRSPGNYCPLLCPLSAQRRRNIILNSMRKLNFIDEQQYKDAVLAQADIIEVEEQEVAPHFLAPHLKEMIRLELEDVIGKKDLYTGGYTVQTTINKSLQLQAQQLFKNNVATLRSQFNMPFDGALISIDHNNGEIKALVGGYDFHSSKFNRALQAKRQLGSIIKPLIYAVAVKKGMNFAQTEIDEPLAINDNGKIWSPNNHDMQFHGSMTLAQALAQSNNIISIKVLLKIGAQEVISIAKKM
ncbi:MAG: transglycosylase domain-containing protein [Actinobacteria bacterium]|nr:transglycosylase domain-containing protein [Actinomycetota bacterium]